MAAFNKVILMGNLTKDPELRYTGGGSAVCSFRLAVNRAYKTQTGELRDDTCYIDVTAWGKTGENCSNYLRKGSPVLAEGYLRYETWVDKATGGNRSRHSVSAETIRFLGGPQRDEEAQQSYQQSAPAYQVPQTSAQQYNAAPVQPVQPVQYSAPAPSAAPVQPVQYSAPAPSAAPASAPLQNKTPETPSFDPPPMPEFDSEVEDDIPF